MSNFNRLSQAIGVAVHKAVKEQLNLGDDHSKEFVTNQILYDLSVRNAVKDLVEYTIKTEEK